MFDPKQFDRGSDFRGDYPRQVNEELAFFVGRYLVRFLRDEHLPTPKVLVGRDGRNSSHSVYSAFIEGAASEGGTAIPCGLAPTDAVCWGAGARWHGADAGVMITASHNPPEYNGIKIVRPKSGKKPGLDIIRPLNLKKYLEADSHHSALAVSSPVLPYPGTPLPLVREFVTHGCEWAPDRAKFTGTIVIDPGNGVGSVFLDPLREEVKNARIEAIAATIDGRFPSRPSNPGLPGAMAALQAKVKELGAAFGAAFDGDADRLFMVDEKGRVVTGDQLLAAIAASILPHARAAAKPVAFAGTCSWAVIETIFTHGGEPILCKVGQDTLKAAMQNLDAVFGGESSAHFNFPESYYQDSGLIALMAFGQALHATKKSVSQTIAELPRWHQSGEMNIRILSEDWSEVGKKVSTELANRYRKNGDFYVLTIDGVSAYSPRLEEFRDETDLFRLAPGDDRGERYRRVAAGYRPDWWFSLRRSNNEPLLRLNLECASAKTIRKQTSELLAEVRDLCADLGDCETEVVDWGTLDGLKKNAHKKKPRKKAQ